MAKTLTAFLLATCVMLTGCIPTAVVVGATAGGAILYDKRGLKQMGADSNITYAAKTALNNNKALLQNSHIDVACYNSILLLVGHVPNAQTRQEASKLVTNIPNVSRTYNEITVQAPGTKKKHASNFWLSTKVRLSMLKKSGLRSTNIKIVASQGTVFLMGNISHKQADLAVHVARRVKGVEKVIKVFQYPL